MSNNGKLEPRGYRWRSSKIFIILTASGAMFSDGFLYGFIVPILKHMIQDRLKLDPSRTQSLTSALLSLQGFISLGCAPIVAHFADKTPNRKIPLLISLAGLTAGTILVACTPSLWALFLGRVLQAVSGSGGWIIALAMIADTVDPQHFGKVFGFAMSFVTAGILAGPMVAGSLFQLLGYWPAWSVPLVLLSLDFIARLVIVENPYQPSTTSSVASAISPVEADESTSLIASGQESHESIKPDPNSTADAVPPRSFYSIMLSDKRVVAALLNSLTLSSIFCGFDTTLPLHVGSTFGWDTLIVGTLFLALTIPSILLGPLIGWLRDRVGARYPTAIGWALVAPQMWLLGAPGHPSFKWADPETNGKAIYIASLIGIGITSTLMRGVSSFQLPSVAREMESKDANIFGKHGGKSRVFSMSEVAFNIGLVLGPLVAGSLTDAFGYYYAYLTLATTSLVMALVTFSCFDSKLPSKSSEEQEH